MRNKMNIAMLLLRIEKELNEVLHTAGLEHSLSVATDAHMFINCNYDLHESVDAVELGKKMDSCILSAEAKAYIWSYFEPMNYEDVAFTSTGWPITTYKKPVIEDVQAREFICITNWWDSIRDNKSYQLMKERTFDIQFQDKNKVIVIEGIPFKIKEGTEYAMKPNSPRFKNRTIQCGSYTALKRYLVKATFEDFWVPTIHEVLKKFVPEN